MSGMAWIVGDVAFTALCIWLIVRVINRKERWAKWTLAGVIGLPALYVASFGPWCWIQSWRFVTDPSGARAVLNPNNAAKSALTYRPIFHLWWDGPEPVQAAIHWYANVLSNGPVGPARIGQKDTDEPASLLFPYD